MNGKKIDIQRLRNLTTGRLHTSMIDIYQDIEFFTSEKGVMTHMIPRALDALTPFLKDQFPDPRLWDGEYDTAHVGKVEARPLSEDEMADFWEAYSAMPNPLLGKTVIPVAVGAK